MDRNLVFLIICFLNISPFHEAVRPSTGLQEPLKNGALRLEPMKKGAFLPYSGPSGCIYVDKNGRECHIHPKSFAGGVQQKNSDGMIESTIRGLAPPSGPSSCTYKGKNGEDCPIPGKMSAKNVHQESKNGVDCPVRMESLPRNVHQESSSGLMQLESIKKGLVPTSGPSSCSNIGGKNGGDCPIHEKISAKSVRPKGLLPPPSAGPSGCMRASNRGGECHVQGKNFATGVGVDSLSNRMASLTTRFHAHLISITELLG
ncbi:hypothetical protein ACLOJK_032315 [Asimina triloba]